MTENYEPGTVAVATVCGVRNVRVLHLTDGHGWVTAEYVDRRRFHDPDGVTDVRPLVVLDLSEIDEDAATTWDEVVGNLRQTDDFTAICISDQIEAQTKPPRIPEPGLWGVVEAGWDSRAETGLPRAEWVRVKGNLWHSTIAGVSAPWQDLIDPVLVREGVAS